MFKFYRIANKAFAEEMLKCLSFTSFILEGYETELQNIISCENYIIERGWNTFLRFEMVSKDNFSSSLAGGMEIQILHFINKKRLKQEQLALAKSNQVLLHLCSQGSDPLYPMNTSFFHSIYGNVKDYVERS